MFGKGEERETNEESRDINNGEGVGTRQGVKSKGESEGRRAKGRSWRRTKREDTS